MARNVTQHSASYKARLDEGRRIAKLLGEPLVPLSVAAKKLGISETALRNAELLALAKISAALNKYAVEEDLIP